MTVDHRNSRDCTSPGNQPRRMLLEVAEDHLGAAGGC
jgi:hypothetical protein